MQTPINILVFAHCPPCLAHLEAWVAALQVLGRRCAGVTPANIHARLGKPCAAMCSNKEIVDQQLHLTGTSVVVKTRVVADEHDT